MSELLLQAKQKRTFVNKDLETKSWEVIGSYYKNLLDRKISSVNDLVKWWLDRSELNAVMEEELAWIYIKMNCDTTNEKLSDQFNYFISEIEPEIAKYSDLLNKKFVESKELESLDKQKYFVPIRSIKKEIEIFREENIPVVAEIQKEEQEYGRIAAQMTVEYKGKELTLQQAANYLKDTNRPIREEVFKLMEARRQQDVDKLHESFSLLIAKRDSIAKVAGYENFRDYRFDDLGRFDYGTVDCFEFHNSIEKEVCPIIDEIHEFRKKTLGLEALKPWDMEVDIDLKPPLKPFSTPEELVDKAIQCFNSIRPKYGDFLSIMKTNGYLDLGSRKGKAPGGFNYPLYESNVPFIFMNATGNLRDVETMVHEGGHAIHSFLSSGLELVDFKSLPSEVAELASMSMELISMEHWEHFFTDKDELKRAKLSQLEGVIKVLPWIATIDQFQHWVYTNVNHSIKERDENWVKIAEKFSSKIVDREGVEDSLKYSWQKQLHLFEVPFYYIEYGIAQLGALAIWRNYKKDKKFALDNYENALQLGYSEPISKIYETAGIKFDFSREYVHELMNFLKEEINAIASE